MVSRGASGDGLAEELARWRRRPARRNDPGGRSDGFASPRPPSLAAGRGQKPEGKSRVGLGVGSGRFGDLSPPSLAWLLLCRLHANWVCLTS